MPKSREKSENSTSFQTDISIRTEDRNPDIFHIRLHIIYIKHKLIRAIYLERIGLKACQCYGDENTVF